LSTTRDTGEQEVDIERVSAGCRAIKEVNKGDTEGEV
jgi:hypothetical protein